MKKMRKNMLERAKKTKKILQNKKRGRYILDEFNLLPHSNITPITMTLQEYIKFMEIFHYPYIVKTTV